MFQENAKVVDHFTIASKTHLIRLQCPKIASLIRPGQFVMIKLPGGNDPLLGRPFALYDTTLDALGQVCKAHEAWVRGHTRTNDQPWAMF